MEAWRGEKVWTAPLAIAGNAIYFFTDKSLFAAELQTGRQLWNFSAEEINESIFLWTGYGLSRKDCCQNLVTSEKWKSRIFIAGTTISKASSPVARTAGASSSTLFSISIMD